MSREWQNLRSCLKADSTISKHPGRQLTSVDCMNWPDKIRNNSLAYIMSLLDAGTKNSGIQESSDKEYIGFNAFNVDLTMPHAASVGTSIAGTLFTLLILYGVYALCRYCWRKREEKKELSKRALIMAIQAQMIGGAPPQQGHTAALQTAHAVLQGGSHVPGPAGQIASAAAAALNHMGHHHPTAPDPHQSGQGNVYPMIAGFAK